MKVPEVHAVRSRRSQNPTTYLRKYPSMMVQKDPGDEQETDAFIFSLFIYLFFVCLLDDYMVCKITSLIHLYCCFYHALTQFI